MPLSNFTRPAIPYGNAPLPNDNRFNIITRVLKKPITTDQLDGEFNKLTDNCNILDNKIEDIQVGIITGSDNPLNAGKFVTTDGAEEPTLSWTNVTSNNIDDGAIPGSKITPLTIGTEQLDDGIVTRDKVPNNSMPYSKMDFDEEDIPYSVINVPNGAIPGSKITGKSITQAQQGLLSVGTEELIDGSATLVKLAAEVRNFINALVPVGESMQWSGTVAPTSIPNLIEWKEENGQLLSRITYAALFSVIGIEYGAGDGVTTFALPDRRGRTSVGIGSDNSTGGRITNATAPNIALGATGVFGSETITLNIDQIPPHTHSIPYEASVSHGGDFPRNDIFGELTTTTGSSGGGLPHNNTQPSIFVRFYIRAL